MTSLRVILISMLFIMASIVFAQVEPSVTVTDQISTDGTVIVTEAVSDGFGWIVIHRDNDGELGGVIGFRSLSPGLNRNIIVPLDLINATPILYAVLHTDSEPIGRFEFGSIEEADLPIEDDNGLIAPAFSVDIMRAYDQFVDEDNIFTVDLVITNARSFVVLYADDGTGNLGDMIGFSLIEAGLNSPVDIYIDGDVTDTVFPMLHVDTNEAGVYEFGFVDGADEPVVIDEQIATLPVATVPNIRATNQLAFGSDAMGGGNPTVHINQVLSAGAGWLVIHADDDGNPGEVLGLSPVNAGLNVNVNIGLNTEDLTPVIFPMLHEDTGDVTVYEFGDVEGADEPVAINGEILTFPINAAPSITYSSMLEGTTLTVEQALIDLSGWLVIHADNGAGEAGEIIGMAPLLWGMNVNIAVELDQDSITETLFAMLHYDTGNVGVYEFGTVEGADGPVIVLGDVVGGALIPEVIE